jgi:mannan endo-1,4-beta-mannosidase
LRFAHEMNGNWYPWAEAANDNEPGDYRQAWRYVHDKFADVYRTLGIASNVNWVWAPNVNYQGSTPLRCLYPGRRYVDWVGLDGYNDADPVWKSFFDVFNETLTELSQFPRQNPILARHPLIITETACTENSDPAGPSKAIWITDFFNELINGPWASEISAFVWFNIDKSTPGPGENWTIQSLDPLTGAQDAEAAFVAGLDNTNLVLGQACF